MIVGFEIGWINSLLNFWYSQWLNPFFCIFDINPGLRLGCLAALWHYSRHTHLSWSFSLLTWSVIGTLSLGGLSTAGSRTSVASMTIFWEKLVAECEFAWYAIKTVSNSSSHPSHVWWTHVRNCDVTVPITLSAYKLSFRWYLVPNVCLHWPKLLSSFMRSEMMNFLVLNVK